MDRLTHILALLTAAAVASVIAPLAEAQMRPKRIIASGWDVPTPQQLRRDLAAVEELPLDGVLVEIRAFGQPDDINLCPLREAFRDRRWERQWFTQSIEDLRAVGSLRLTHNFANLNANPGNVDWFDDAGWENVVDHWRIAAWIAREGGLKGIAFDPEPYTEPYRQFKYTAQPNRQRYTFAEYYAKARQRGREVMQAVIEEYPDITILTYFMNSYVAISHRWLGPRAAGLPDPTAALLTHGYGLYPAFIDGWLDVLPPAATLVDGCELAYGYTRPVEFWEAAARIKGDGQEVVSPENRAKYRAQVEVGFGIYLDAHHPVLGGRWALNLGERSPAEMLEHNVRAALAAADQYIWLWGERGRWWPEPSDTAKWPGQPVHPRWPEQISGIVEALEAARDPRAARRRQVEAAGREARALLESGQAQNLARNPGFDRGPDETLVGAPAEWWTWQSEESDGELAWDPGVGAAAPGSARLSRVGEGCYGQEHEVTPGQRYFVAAACQVRGQGSPSLTVRWKTPEGVWLEEAQLDQSADWLYQRPPTGEWHDLSRAVTVPEGAGRLVLLLGVGGQVSDRDVAWFDDVLVVQLTGAEDGRHRGG